MPLELGPTALALTPPDVLVINLVAVFGGNLDSAVRENGRDFGAPGFEARAVRLVFDPGHHEVG